MDNMKTLELEILIVISHHRRVPAQHFSRLFEHQWNLYENRFNELLAEGFLQEFTNPEMTVYELTSKGKERIGELIEERETDIAIKLIQLKQKRPVPVRTRRYSRTLLHSIVHFCIPHKKLETQHRG